MADPNVQSRFNYIAPVYEATRKKFIPDFDTFYQSGVRFLQCEKTAPHVLDLGAGTGLYTNKLLERYPHAEVTLVDFAENMLDIARQNFAGNPNIHFTQADYSSYDFAGEKFDIIISALSIHHFEDVEKKKIYNKVYLLLKPDGEFLNADQIYADTEALNKKYCDLHSEYVKSNASREDYEQFLKNIELDRRSPVPMQLEWLKTAGFTQTDCIFKYLCFAVMYGRK
ncbi:MAG: class I SAM-dependent methyltransferase [Clostridiales bacterium]|jgi:tRNA (cmo5U34)-methyltransferase|nr:class I SAM-dependent methyltransferase [Clostridiales bacterium]